MVVCGVMAACIGLPAGAAGLLFRWISPTPFPLPWWVPGLAGVGVVGVVLVLLALRNGGRERLVRAFGAGVFRPFPAGESTLVRRVAFGFGLGAAAAGGWLIVRSAALGPYVAIRGAELLSLGLLCAWVAWRRLRSRPD